MKICSKTTEIYKELDFFLLCLVIILVSREPISWMSEHLNIFLITKWKFRIFRLYELIYVGKKKHIRANSDDQIISSEVSFFADYSVLSLKGNEMSLLYCLSTYIPVVYKTITFLELLSQHQVFLLGFFFICSILNLSFVILLFEVYLCNKFINRLQMAGYTILIL